MKTVTWRSNKLAYVLLAKNTPVDLQQMAQQIANGKVSVWQCAARCRAVHRHSTKKKSQRFENKTRSNVGPAFADARRLAFAAPKTRRAGALSAFSIYARVTV
ncbi:hypothetical protein [Paraburkholderia piptadeniae]|nr:hypothetical protein [Paraburkholderia piptadeniae]